MKMSQDILMMIMVYNTLSPETTMIPRCGLKFFIVIQMLSVTG